MDTETDQDAKREQYVPEGYDTVEEFLEEARERFQQGVDHERENTDAALDDLKFLAGEQWDPQVAQARREAGRPCLTINRLPAFLAQVVGDIRINRPAIRVRPAEDGDKAAAEVRQGLIRHIEHNSRAGSAYIEAGMQQTACGLGHFRVTLDYAGDDVFDRDIVVKPIKDTFSVVWDPLRTDPTGKDARFCFVTEEMDKKAFEEAFPDSQGSDLYQRLDESGWVKSDTIRVTEYWVMKSTRINLGLTQDGRVIEVPQGADPATLGLMLDKMGRPRVRQSVRRSACMYLITGREILDGPYEFPITRLPIFRVPGWEMMIGGKPVRWGLVRFAKDPARLMNYWRSVAAETLALAPKTQWLVHGSEDEEYVEDFRRAHLGGDPVLRWEGDVPPVRQDPPPVPAAVLNEAQMAAQDMKDVTGIHDASLGAQSNETSGRAIMARDRQGDVATFVYPDNLRMAIEECGRVINDLLPVVYDTARTVRILGEDETVKTARINDPTHPESIDLGVGKYDVVVETGPSYSTKRVEAADSMMQFVQAVPTAAAVAGDLIAKAQDWPMADQIAERLKRAMPPQIVAEEGAQPDPAQQQAQQMQMQAAQMAQQQAQQQIATGQIEMAIKQADLRKRNAEAVKAEAEAARAQLEAAMMVQGPVAPLYDDLEQQAFGQGMAAPGIPPMAPPPVG